MSGCERRQARQRSELVGGETAAQLYFVLQCPTSCINLSRTKSWCVSQPICTVETGSRPLVMTESYYPVHCRRMSHGDKGKWRQVLCAAHLALFASVNRIFSAVTLSPVRLLSFPFFSSLLRRSTFQPPPRGPLGATLGSICCWFTSVFGAGSSWRRQSRSDLKVHRAAAAAGAEFGFLSPHVFTLMGCT